MDPSVNQIFPPQLQKLFQETLQGDSRAMEQEFDAILDGMEKSNMLTTKARKHVHARIAEDIATGLMVSLVQSLTDEDKKKLHSLYHSGLNEHQQLATIRLLYKQRTGKEWEETLIDLYDRALKQFISEYHILRQTAEEASKLSDEDCNQVNALIEQGKWQEALEEFERLSSRGTSAVVSSTPQAPVPQNSAQQGPQFTSDSTDTQQPHDQMLQQPENQDRQQSQPAGQEMPYTSSQAVHNAQNTEEIISLLKQGRFEEAKRLMDEV